MRFRSSLHEVLARSGAAVLLWLLTATPATAAQAPRPLPRPAPIVVSDLSTTFSLTKLVRRARLVRGSTARRFRLALFDLAHGNHGLGRQVRPAPRDEDQVIQNDAPAMPMAVRPLLALRPLGVFVEAVEPRTAPPAHLPRSPRGPPAAA